MDVRRRVFAQDSIDAVGDGELGDFGSRHRINRGTLAHAVDDALELVDTHENDTLHQRDVFIVVSRRDEYCVTVVGASETTIYGRKISGNPNGLGLNGIKTP